MSELCLGLISLDCIGGLVTSRSWASADWTILCEWPSSVCPDDKTSNQSQDSMNNAKCKKRTFADYSIPVHKQLLPYIRVNPAVLWRLISRACMWNWILSVTAQTSWRGTLMDDDITMTYKSGALPSGSADPFKIAISPFNGNILSI